MEINSPLSLGRHESLLGFRITVVPEGTRIKSSRTDEVLIVGGESTVVCGNEVYCTEQVYKALVKALGPTQERGALE